jgi:hypothetical protein
MRWLSILWPKLMRGAPTREGRGSVRGGRGVVSESSSVRAWRWPLAVGVAVGALHFLLFPPLPRIAAEFPAAGEISTREIRAPFTFSAPQLERDVEMRRLEKVLVEPPVLRRLTTTASGDSRSRFEAFREALRIQLAHAEVPLAERVSLLALRFPAIPEDELRRVLTVVDPERVLALMREALVEVCDDGVTDMLPPGNYSKVVLLGPDSEMLQDVSLLTPQARL